MKDTLSSQGWTLTATCNCGGSYREDYINGKFPGHEVRIRPFLQPSGTFSILAQGMIIYGPDWAYKMEEKLKLFGVWRSLTDL